MLSVELIKDENFKDFKDSVNQLKLKRFINAEKPESIKSYFNYDRYLIFSLKLGSKSDLKYGLAMDNEIYKEAEVAFEQECAVFYGEKQKNNIFRIYEVDF